MIQRILNFQKSLLYIFLSSVIFSREPDDTLALDLDAMWENTIWEEIQEVTDRGYEVEKVTPVAGVRGAEAEDEALALLYYRKSMKGLSKLDLQKAYGKLKNKRDELLKINPKHKDIPKLTSFMKQIKNRL